MRTSDAPQWAAVRPQLANEAAFLAVGVEEDREAAFHAVVEELRAAAQVG